MEHQPRNEGVWPFNYHRVNQPWQIGTCASMSLRFVCTNVVSDSGGPFCICTGVDSKFSFAGI